MLGKTLVGVLAIAGLSAMLAFASVGAGAQSEQMKRDRDCGSFGSQAAAQNYFIGHGGPSSDPDGLDADHDGVACESNPCPCSTGTGGGPPPPPPAPPPPPPEPVKTKKLCGKFVGIGGSRVCLKAVTQGGKLKRVEDFRFRGLPADCGGGKKPKLTGKDAKIDGDGKKFRSRHPKVLGGFSGVDAKIAGRIKGGANKARGVVRVRATDKADEGCDTGGRKWKAS